MVDAQDREEPQPVTGPVHRPQASPMIGHLRGGAMRSERAMTVLDLLRTRGQMSTEDVRVAFGHANTFTVNRYLRELEAEGLVEVVVPHGLGRSTAGKGKRTAVWAITEHGRTVV